MIKAAARGKDGKPLLILGLSRRNTELLLEGRPISIELKRMTGIAGTLLLIAAENEAVLAAQLAPFMGPNTQFEGPEPWEKEGG